MNKALLSMATAATALIATSVNAAPTSVSNGPVQAHATIVKPLTLTKVSDMDFGSIVVQDNGTASLANSGTLTCPATLTCSGTGTPAEYTVTGTNNQVVFITKPNVTLTNSGNPGTPLTLVLTGPTQITLPNSGASGINFKLGGDLAILATTKEGVYQGDLAVTVNY
jgi:Mat/Ecp fimbriae major subunit